MSEVSTAPSQGDAAYYDGLPRRHPLVVDVHMHYRAEEGFLEGLFREMDAAGVDVTCLISTGPDFGGLEERDWKRIFRELDDRIVGLGLFKPGWHRLEVVDEYRELGFRGLKAIRPKKRYDHDDYHAYYERAEELDMPILFHTGVVARHSVDTREDVSSAYMRPIYLDRIARCFPKLKVIAAHMGDPWFFEAYMTSQKNPNMWLDISGKGIWLKASAIRQALWIRLRPEKLLFGLDEPPSEYTRLIHAWDTLLYEIGLSQGDRDKIFGGTAAKIFGV